MALSIFHGTYVLIDHYKPDVLGREEWVSGQAWKTYLSSPNSNPSLQRWRNQDQRKEANTILKSKDSFTYLIIKMNKD